MKRCPKPKSQDELITSDESVHSIEYRTLSKIRYSTGIAM